MTLHRSTRFELFIDVLQRELVTLLQRRLHRSTTLGTYVPHNNTALWYFQNELIQQKNAFIAQTEVRLPIWEFRNPVPASTWLLAQYCFLLYQNINFVTNVQYYKILRTNLNTLWTVIFNISNLSIYFLLSLTHVNIFVVPLTVLTV